MPEIFITTVKYSCPLQPKMFSRSQFLPSFISQASNALINIPEEVHVQQGNIFPTLGHETISSQCIILVFLLKKKYIL